MRDDYLAPAWAEHHGQWSDFVAGAIRRAAALPGSIARLARAGGGDRRRQTHKEA